MLRVIGVDDEKISLDRFERIMKGETRVSVVGTFVRAADAIEFTSQNPVDIAFLDIEMPGVSGLELAERLLEKNPHLEIVFITAYNQYALKAFQIHAIGYLLKPLDIDAVREQIDSLVRRLGHRRDSMESNYLNVKCLGQFLCYTDENGDEPIRWRTAKAEELFALLIHYRGKAISREILIDTLWPEVDPEKAANNFRVTCTYIRNTLADKGFTNMLLRERDSYMINCEMLRCDWLVFLSMTRGGALTERLALERASILYAGEYFENKPYEWATNNKTWLENEYKKIQNRLANEYLNEGDNKAACLALEKLLEQDPLEEDVVERLVSLNLQSGDSIAAIKIYRNYEQRLMKELGLLPSDRLREIIAANNIML